MEEAYLNRSPEGSEITTQGFSHTVCCRQEAGRQAGRGAGGRAGRPSQKNLTTRQNNETHIFHWTSFSFDYGTRLLFR